MSLTNLMEFKKDPISRMGRFPSTYTNGMSWESKYGTRERDVAQYLGRRGDLRGYLQTR